MLLFVVLWLVGYPMQVWRSLRFQYRDSKADVALCAGVWVWIIGAILTICYLIGKGV